MGSSAFSPPAATDASVESPPTLESGDALTAQEFLRRYEAMSDVKKAELVEGIAYVGSPVHLKAHGEADAFVVGLLFLYDSRTPGVVAAANTTTLLDLDNVPQPDSCLRLEEDLGGTARVSADDYLEGAPELVVEVAATSATKDLRDKKRAYRRHGVREYLVLLTGERCLRAFRLQGEDYVETALDSDGLWHSKVFPGLWLSVPAIIARDASAARAALERGLSSLEHADFVAGLARRRREASGT